MALSWHIGDGVLVAESLAWSDGDGGALLYKVEDNEDGSWSAVFEGNELYSGTLPGALRECDNDDCRARFDAAVLAGEREEKS